MGVWQGCATTWPGYAWDTGDVLFTYPGQGTSHRFEETASESPFVPGDFVGLPEGTTTGPHLYVLYGGQDAPRLTSATLSGPDGNVEVRSVDSQTPELGGYLAAASIVIPVCPLRPRAQYTASVALAADDRQLSKQWTFSTIGVDPESSLSAYEGSAVFESASPAPASVQVVGRSGRVAAQTTMNASQEWGHNLPGGDWTFCWDQPANGAYEGASGCDRVTYKSRPRVKLGNGRRVGRYVRFRLTVSQDLVGQTARVRTRRSFRKCWRATVPPGQQFSGRPYRRCVLRPRPRSWRTVRRALKTSQVVKIRRVNRGGRIQIRVATPGFARGDADYRRSETGRSYRQR